MTEINWSGLISIFVFMAVIMSMGFILKRRSQKKKIDFFLGGRQIGPIVTAVSFCCAYFGTGVVVSGSSMTYRYGLGYSSLNVFASILFSSVLVFALMALKMRAVSERCNASSLPSFLQARFESNTLRILSSIVIVIFTIPYGIAGMKAMGDVLFAITGIPYAYGVILITIAAIFYMVTSGYWGMAWIDMLQGFLMLFGVLLMSFFCIRACGGFANMNVTVQAQLPDHMTMPGPLTWFQFLSYSLVWPLMTFGQPSLVTKYMSLKDVRTMGTVIITSSVFMFLFLINNSIFGIAGRYLFGDAYLSNTDLIAPTIAAQYGGNFVSAMFLVACIAAGLSTLGALGMSASGTIMRDIYQEGILKKRGEVLPEKKANSISRVLTIVTVIVIMFFSFAPFDLVWEIGALAGAATGAAFTGPLFLGLYWKKATKAGCIVSVISGTVVCAVWYFLGLNSIIHAFVPATIVSLALFFVVSLITHGPSAQTISMFFDKNYKKSQSLA
ncbi:MAG: hypothetical protein Q4D04_03960 [Clostridia bacterium]|nr:hypothetical protein [Clostridia bacterium]